MKGTREPYPEWAVTVGADDDDDRVRFTLNGRPVAIEPAPGESLLDALRERCGVTSIKDGCQPQGQCGCCLALIDGRPLVTCAFEAERAEGREVLTLEGVSAARARGRLEGLRRRRRRAVRLLHPRDRAARQAPPRPPAGPEPRRDRPRHRRPPLPLHRLRADRRGRRADGEGLARRRAAGAASTTAASGKPLARYGALDQALGERPYVADMQRPGPAARRARPLRARAGPGRAHRHVEGRGAPRRARRGDRRGRARRALVRPPVRRLAGLRGRGRGGALRRRRPRRGGGRRRADGARGGGARRGRVRAAAAGARPRGRARPRRAAGQPEAPEPALALGHPPAATRRRPSPRAPTS